MSDRGPGTRGYLIDTGLIALAGVALAIWLWEGWPFAAFLPAGTSGTGTQATDLGDFLDAGCVTAENLTALREGRATRIACPDGTERP